MTRNANDRYPIYYKLPLSFYIIHLCIYVYRCFSCKHPDCKLAGGLANGGNSELNNISACYKCDGTMKLKSTKDKGGIMIGCSKYPSCNAIWWLPKFVRSGKMNNCYDL